MNDFDQNILTISDNICKNIDSLTEEDRGFRSQNILNSLRNLVEAVDQRIYSDVAPIELNRYEDIEESIRYVASRGQLRFLSKFHNYLQASVSHFTPDEDGAVRLMLKYYEWLIRIREYCKTSFGLLILGNLEDYPLDMDSSMDEYYGKISQVLNSAHYDFLSKPSDRYYVLKSRPFFVDGKIYYELSIVSADDYTSKFNRITVFSDRDIPTHYAIKIDFINVEIDITNRKMPIMLINNYKVAIRPVELDDIATILNVKKVNPGTAEYNLMMDYLTRTGFSLVDIIDFDDKYYSKIKDDFIKKCSSKNMFNMLDICRQLSLQKIKGYNIVRYLLLELRHGIMSWQIASRPNNWLSNLWLVNESIPFDDMPFDASLSEHNPRLRDVFECINPNGHEDEILSRKIRTNTEQRVQLFTSKADIKVKGNIDDLVKKFNSRLIREHKPKRSLFIDGDDVFINGYVNNTVWIINNLISRKGNGLAGYSNSMKSWAAANPAVDSDEKKAILPEIFSTANVAMIYGAAGTGKTTLIKHLADYFANERKLFLANTNPAKEHLRREIKIQNSDFSTIASSKQYITNQYDVVFIDECSTVDNFAMRKLLERLQCTLLVLVGDIFQIQAIKFGNWFGLVRYFLPKQTIFELTTPFRSNNKNLVGLWNKVRTLDPKIEEYIVRNKYSAELDESIFVRDVQDEIILCLNYDGLYGINNINRFLQNDNPNRAVTWGASTYKVGDPVIFNENNRFFPILYNNLKGWIRGINKINASITFTIEVDMLINEFGARDGGFELLECDVQGHSLIRFTVDRYFDDDTKEKSKNQVVPFQVAYAISIHKAQGLEYDSVKIVVTNEIEERITHNIFYTAITRARNKLKIYWTPETQQEILSTIEPVSNAKDANILANRFGLTILNRVEQVKRTY